MNSWKRKLISQYETGTGGKNPPYPTAPKNAAKVTEALQPHGLRGKKQRRGRKSRDKEKKSRPLALIL